MTLIEDTPLVKVKRKKKIEDEETVTSDGIRTHDLLISRHVLYRHCATTLAQSIVNELRLLCSMGAENKPLSNAKKQSIDGQAKPVRRESISKEFSVARLKFVFMHVI